MRGSELPSRPLRDVRTIKIATQLPLRGNSSSCKQQQGIARRRETYERLFHVEPRTPEEDLEMAECCLALIEASVFSRRQTERVRMLLRRVPAKAREELMQRVLVLERDPET